MSFARTVLKATDRVQECIEHCPPGAPKETRWIVKGFRESCVALGDLLIEPDLLHYLRLQVSPVLLDEARRQIVAYRQNGQALDRFLEAERELFARAGLAVSVTDHLIEKIRSVIKEPSKATPDSLIEGLGSLKDYVCDRFDRSAASRNRSVLAGMRDVFGGLAVATLNGGLLAATVGITGAASAVSISVGGVIAADGYAAIRRLF